MDYNFKMSIIIYCVVFVFALFINDVHCLQLFSTDSDILRNSSQLINSRGFDHELHSSITEDGYILTLVRLVNPYRSGYGHPIYLQHGLFGNSDNFLLSQHEILTPSGLLDQNSSLITNCTGQNSRSVGRSLAYVLSSCGYDVWLGNFRGNRYSNRHILLNSSTDGDYWTYTVDHLSEYDLVANIQYILQHTGRSELAYIGHSLGTSAMFQLLSSQPEYSRYIRPAIMLAPVAHVSHIRAPLLLLASYNPPLVKWLRKALMPIFGLPSELISILDQMIATFICGNQLFRPLCTIFLFTLCGFDYPNLDQSMIPFAYGHFPDDTASRILSHLAQRVTGDTFAYYDYGKDINIRKYSQPEAPAYNLSRIDSEYLILISSINDWLADPDDVDIIRSHLKVKPYEDYVIPYELFNHADFLLGKNVGQYQNSKILQWLQRLLS